MPAVCGRCFDGPAFACQSTGPTPSLSLHILALNCIASVLRTHKKKWARLSPPSTAHPFLYNNNVELRGGEVVSRYELRNTSYPDRFVFVQSLFFCNVGGKQAFPLRPQYTHAQRVCFSINWIFCSKFCPAGNDHRPISKLHTITNVTGPSSSQYPGLCLTSANPSDHWSGCRSRRVSPLQYDISPCNR